MKTSSAMRPPKSMAMLVEHVDLVDARSESFSRAGEARGRAEGAHRAG
jgi:hypothetical protein